MLGQTCAILLGIMLKRYTRTGRLYCFSPPVMLATFLIEFGLAFYTIWRYKLTTVSRLATTMLLGLGTFQLAEYMVCGGLGWTGAEWSRLGYISITLLPAVGLHLISALAGKKSTYLIGGAYLSCVAFAVFFALAPGAVNFQECRPNYAVFHVDKTNYFFYTLYYYGWLFAGIFLALRWAKQVPKKKARALYAMAIGYVLFMLPTTTVNLIDPSTIAGIPSIMCGFAILLAVAISGYVLPNSTKLRHAVVKRVAKKGGQA